MSSSTPTFTHVEQVLLGRLRAGGDVAIAVLYAAAYDVAHDDLPSNRVMQTMLGPRITVLNRKLVSRGEKVVPGFNLKRTYTLTRLPPGEETTAAAE